MLQITEVIILDFKEVHAGEFSQATPHWVLNTDRYQYKSWSAKGNPWSFGVSCIQKNFVFYILKHERTISVVKAVEKPRSRCPRVKLRDELTSQVLGDSTFFYPYLALELL